MESIYFKRPAHTAELQPILVGYVGSGDLEVMIEPAQDTQAIIHIQTSAHGSEVRWRQVIELIETEQSLPAMRMSIHDFSATPGVIRLRIEQALEMAMCLEVSV